MRIDGSNLRRELEKEWKGEKEMKVKKMIAFFKYIKDRYLKKLVLLFCLRSNFKMSSFSLKIKRKSLSIFRLIDPFGILRKITRPGLGKCRKPLHSCNQ